MRKKGFIGAIVLAVLIFGGIILALLFAIYAGTLNSRNKNLWQNKTECTDEALCAVRDYMVQELLGGIDCHKATSSGYEWTLKDGRTVELRVTIKESSP